MFSLYIRRSQGDYLLDARVNDRFHTSNFFHSENVWQRFRLIFLLDRLLICIQINVLSCLWDLFILEKGLFKWLDRGHGGIYRLKWCQIGFLTAVRGDFFVFISISNKRNFASRRRSRLFFFRNLNLKRRDFILKVAQLSLHFDREILLVRPFLDYHANRFVNVQIITRPLVLLLWSQFVNWVFRNCGWDFTKFIYIFFIQIIVNTNLSWILFKSRLLFEIGGWYFDGLLMNRCLSFLLILWFMFFSSFLCLLLLNHRLGLPRQGS
jgi:hypothetical protein